MAKLYQSRFVTLPRFFFRQLTPHEWMISRYKHVDHSCGNGTLNGAGSGTWGSTDVGVAGDHQTAETEDRFFEDIVGIRKVEPARETRSASLGKELDRAECGKVAKQGFVVIRPGGDPHAIVTERFGLSFCRRMKIFLLRCKRRRC